MNKYILIIIIILFCTILAFACDLVKKCPTWIDFEISTPCTVAQFSCDCSGTRVGTYYSVMDYRNCYFWQHCECIKTEHRVASITVDCYSSCGMDCNELRCPVRNPRETQGDLCVDAVCATF